MQFFFIRMILFNQLDSKIIRLKTLIRLCTSKKKAVSKFANSKKNPTFATQLRNKTTQKQLLWRDSSVG